ncbi:hypothetical protein [Janthinobacterium fluminis]|uniref:Energy transducer TonB n=1 Tax=Janthinobacterium fluminis TaxID=2987524 RepID=A0ABT5JXA6_9BURK|nr:hypothetical protein [Janthinobacterium fluminis]MDC8757065.1 hypothetical protein [Janthinobacterium fluminis]
MPQNSYSPLYQPRPGRSNTVLAGVVLSLILHAGLLHFFTAPPGHKADAEAHADILNTIVWMPPRKVVEPAPVLVADVAPDISPRSRREAKPRAASAATGAPGEAVAATQAEPITLPAQPAADGATPKFDMNVALQSARKFAGTRATRNDAPNAQLQDKPINELKSENDLARGIGSASRADCKNVASGAGVMALVIVPYLLLTDKKDSGCKW